MAAPEGGRVPLFHLPHPLPLGPTASHTYPSPRIVSRHESLRTPAIPTFCLQRRYHLRGSVPGLAKGAVQLRILTFQIPRIVAKPPGRAPPTPRCQERDGSRLDSPECVEGVRISKNTVEKSRWIKYEARVASIAERRFQQLMKHESLNFELNSISIWSTLSK